jgi:hypothetical protein
MAQVVHEALSSNTSTAKNNQNNPPERNLVDLRFIWLLFCFCGTNDQTQNIMHTT